MTHTGLSRFAALLFIPTLILRSVPAHAGGFGIDYAGARALGTASAGSAAAADATTIFYNPAGLGYLDHNEVIGGGILFDLHDNFTNSGSTILGGAMPTPGTNGRDATSPTLVPWFYASYRITPELAAGVGVYSPFGLSTNYGSDFVGRYQNEASSVTVINFNPTVSYRPLPWLSLGAGVDIEYMHVRLTQAIDFGSACAAALGAATCAAGFGLVPGQSDGQVDNHGDSFGYGFNLGVLVEPVAGTRLGISYRSGIDQHFGRSQQSFVVSAAARAFLTAAGTPLALTGSPINTSLPLPGRLAFGVRQVLTDSLALLFDATLTDWSVFKSTSITALNPATGTSVVVRQGFKDAWRFAAGLEYALNEHWSLRTGVAYEQTPIPLTAFQAALPFTDRVDLSVGTSFRLDGSWSFDLGYGHGFYLGSVPIDRITATGNTLKGSFRTTADVIAGQFRMQY